MTRPHSAQSLLAAVELMHLWTAFEPMTFIKKFYEFEIDILTFDFHAKIQVREKGKRKKVE